VDFRFTRGGGTRLNEESTMVMLNANKVNGPRQNFFLPQFCESFCDSGRILHFKKWLIAEKGGSRRGVAAVQHIVQKWFFWFLPV